MSDRLKVTYALVASVMLHVLLALLLTVWTWLMPASESPQIPELKTVEVTIQPAPQPTPAIIAMAPTPPQKVVRSVLDTDGLEESEKPPDKPLVESDKNSVAGSEKPATGTAPLPSQDGRELPFEQFKTQDYALGNGRQPSLEPAPASTPDAPREPLRAPTPPPEKPKPTPTPQQKPTPKLDSFPDQTIAAASAAPPPNTTPMFNPTPVAKPKANAFALGKPTPVPLVTATPKPMISPTPSFSPPKPRPPSTTEMAMLEAKPERRPERPRPESGYQAQKERTKIEGSISNRGRPGMDALGTPLGRYRKAIADAIGSRWYYYINQRMDLMTVGDVHIKFVITADGRIEDVKILANTANNTFGEFCMRSVTEAKIPPLPSDVAATLDNGRLAVEYHFNLYSQ